MSPDPKSTRPNVDKDHDEAGACDDKDRNNTDDDVIDTNFDILVLILTFISRKSKSFGANLISSVAFHI